MWRIPGGEAEDPERSGWDAEQACFMPAALGWCLVLIDTLDVVCYLDDVRVYPSNCWFQVRSLLKPAASARAREVFAAGDPSGYEPPGTDDPNKEFLLGLEYEDGRRSVVCVNIHRLGIFDDSAQPPMLRLMGAEWTSGDASAEFVLEGLPDRGAVRLHARWTAFDASESVIELDGDALRAAAERAVPLWPASGFSNPGS